jgi:DNA-binding transcriptional LysR family regulator
VVVRYLTDMRVFRLDYGEAHVAIRAGSVPQEPDNVVQPLVRMRSGLYAARSYVARYGMPASLADFARHRFIASDAADSRAPFFIWLRGTVPETAISYRITDPSAAEAALRAGVGIGFHPAWLAEGDTDLVEVLPPRPEWDTLLWIVSHVDLHRTLKVQSFLAALKSAATGWVGI